MRSQQSEYRTTPVRIRNFRDIGGIITEDRREVISGQLFRSADLSDAEMSELLLLQKLGIKTVVDFRTDLERDRSPSSDLRIYGIETIHLPVLDPARSSVFWRLERGIKTGELRCKDVDEVMIETNRSFAIEWAPMFSDFLRVVIERAGTPLLWHCTGGKDRTGFATALLLRLLGATDEAIRVDYLASRGANRLRASQSLSLAVRRGLHTLLAVRRLTDVDWAWLETALIVIDSHQGGFRGFCGDVLGIFDRDIDRLRAVLLSPDQIG